MGTYTIGETSRRTGFSASALRFYEHIGLVDPAGRTAAGYRLYDDGSLDRLAFIARAKQLDCSLEEITDLVHIRDGQRCGPVQRRFGELVTAKIRDAELRAGQLAALAAQLRAAAERLAADPLDGPCGPECACVSSETGRPPADGPNAVGPGPDDRPRDVAIACTLDPGAVPDRRADWAGVLEHATARTPVDGGLRVALADTADLAELGRLIGAEQRCCAFFRFTLRVDADGIVLDVRAPALAGDIVRDLFGDAT